VGQLSDCWTPKTTTTTDNDDADDDDANPLWLLSEKQKSIYEIISR